MGAPKNTPAVQPLLNAANAATTGGYGLPPRADTAPAVAPHTIAVRSVQFGPVAEERAKDGLACC